MSTTVDKYDGARGHHANSEEAERLRLEGLRRKCWRIWVRVYPGRSRSVNSEAAVILDLESLLAGEYAENEFRKEFAASERIAIGAALEAEDLQKRQGR